jgi:large subunit ribosomal protein L22
MQATAHVRNTRISSRKVDQLLMMVRGKSVAHALATLRLVTKGPRPMVEKALQSAFANAGAGQNPETWYVSQAWVGDGPSIWRMRAFAMGRGYRYRHRTAHMTIILSDEKRSSKKKRALVGSAGAEVK